MLPTLRICLAVSVFCSALALSCKSVRADLILDSIGDLQWNRVLEPNGPAFISFQVHSNGLNVANDDMNAFNVGIRFVPVSGATGTLAIQSISVPTINPVFNTYASTPSVVTVLDAQVINGENGPFANVKVDTTARSMFLAKLFSPSNDALGRFDIYVDRATTNYFATTSFDGSKFFNVPETGDAKGVLLGSLTVSAVPEPSTVGVMALASCLVILRQRRKLTRC